LILINCSKCGNIQMNAKKIRTIDLLGNLV
jgi:hypothetical protein